MRLAERLLRRVLGADQASALIGDIEEEAARVGGISRWWVARQIASHTLGAVRVAAERKHARIRTGLRIAVKDAFRSVRQFPGSTTLAFVIVMLSIAAATVTFSVVDTVVLRRLPFPQEHRLIAIYASHPGNLYDKDVSPQDYYAWREGAESVESLAAWTMSNVSLGSGADSEEIAVGSATGNLFDVLGIRPSIGQAFREHDESRGHAAVVLISHRLWRQRFASDPAVVGRTLPLSDGTAMIVGVMPRDFAFPIETLTPVDIWRPLVISSKDRVYTSEIGRNGSLQVIGRLRDGATTAEARAEIERISSEMAATYPIFYDRWRVRVASLRDSLTEPFRGWMLLALAAVVLVVILGCANVANLLLARSVVRRRDLAIRTALGATRGQIIQSLVIESLLLSCAAAAAGVGLAYFALGVVQGWLPEGISRSSDIAIDARVMLTASAAAVATGLLFGALPAWQASRTDVTDSLKQGGTTASPRTYRWRSTLLVAQTALVGALLVVTTLVIGSLLRVMQADLGFERRNLIAVSLKPSFPGIGDKERQARIDALFRRATEALRALPGVTHVAAAGGSPLPLYPGIHGGFVETTDGPVTVELRSVSPGYFEATGNAILQGRGFDESDKAGGRPVVIIDELTAARISGPRSPIGANVRLLPDVNFTVVGVVANVKVRGPEGETGPQLYHPIAQRPAEAALVVRTAIPAAHAVPAIARIVADLVPAGSPAPEVAILEDQFWRLTASRRFNATVISAFGLLALIIGAAGVYGVTASLVAQQTREIGVRMALGATATRVVRSITAFTGRLLLLGTALGLLGAWATSGVLEALVFGMEPSDWSAYVLPFCVLSIVGLSSAIVPALRAAQVDPLIALRTE